MPRSLIRMATTCAQGINGYLRLMVTLRLSLNFRTDLVGWLRRRFVTRKAMGIRAAVGGGRQWWNIYPEVDSYVVHVAGAPGSGLWRPDRVGEEPHAQTQLPGISRVWAKPERIASDEPIALAFALLQIGTRVTTLRLSSWSSGRFDFGNRFCCPSRRQLRAPIRPL